MSVLPLPPTQCITGYLEVIICIYMHYRYRFCVAYTYTTFVVHSFNVTGSSYKLDEMLCH